MRLGEAPGAQKSQRESFFPEKGFLLAFGMRDNGKESRESRLQSPPPDGGVTRVRARASGLELAPEGTGADSESATRNPGEIARCQGHVEGIKA